MILLTLWILLGIPSSITSCNKVLNISKIITITSTYTLIHHKPIVLGKRDTLLLLILILSYLQHKNSTPWKRYMWYYIRY